MSHLILIFVLFNFMSVASANTTYGSHILVCEGKTAVSLDWYEASFKKANGSQTQLLDFTGMGVNEVLELLSSRLSPYRKFYHLLTNKIRQFGSVDDWLVPPAKLLSSSSSQNLYTLSPGCSIERVFARQTDTVFYRKEMKNLMDPSQVALALMHEYLFYVAGEFGHQDNDSIRELMKILIRSEVNPKELVVALKKMTNSDFSLDYGEFKTYTIDPNVPLKTQIMTPDCSFERLELDTPLNDSRRNILSMKDSITDPLLDGRILLTDIKCRKQKEVHLQLTQEGVVVGDVVSKQNSGDGFRLYLPLVNFDVKVEL